MTAPTTSHAERAWSPPDGDARAAAGAGADLPAWPFALPLLLAPLWWVVGASLLIWVVVAVIGVLLLCQCRGLVAPRTGALLWCLYGVWSLASVVQVDDAGRMVGFGLRILLIGAVGVNLLYLTNLPERRLDLRRGLRWLSAYWYLVVAGGWWGVLAPRFRAETLLHRVLPGSLASNDFADVLFSINSAEASKTAAGTFYRPSAPFPYTNAWGSVFALLLPCMLALLALETRRTVRVLLGATVVLSLVPAFLTLNRMMFVSLGVGLVYAAVRFAARGNLRALFSVGVVVGSVGLMSLVIPVWQLITTRVDSSETNTARAGLYQEAIVRVGTSPWFGFGTPLPSERAYQTSVGTQGQVWAVLFSHGYPGVLLFVAFFLWALWATRGCPSTPEVWLHVVTVVAAVQIGFYGFENQNMLLFSVVLGLALRQRRFASRSGSGLSPEPAT
ncbi:O-antigen ligase family protein [Jatrophihabitans sp. YIM 134969]